jgi:BirA family transcriptional regulator, biotin operon repressor / biotin---[acetyl-CoA-carboxylase] ligase
MSTARATPAAPVTYDALGAEEVASLLALPRVRIYHEVSSTLDVAHGEAEGGAPAGTLVLADAQSAGRGRMGRSWQSEAGRGIWLTLLERPAANEMLSVLSLRIALALAPALDQFTSEATRLKWPNDVYAGGRKLAGILLEARWRGARLDWLAVGIGINLRAPTGYDAASLSPGTRRVDVLAALVPRVREAVATGGPLTPMELNAFAARDLAIGKACELPTRGRVAGIDSSGALLVDTDDGRVPFHGGSLVLSDSAATG